VIENIDNLALIISIVAAGIALLAAWYARQQAVVAERTRALDHDASFRITWARDYDTRLGLDEETGELSYGTPFVRIENIGEGNALDLRSTVNGRVETHRDLQAGWRTSVQASPGERITLTWKARDGKKMKNVLRKLPPFPQWED